MLKPASLVLASMFALAACAAPTFEEPEGETNDESNALTGSAINCTEKAATGYNAGKAYSMTTVTVGSKPTSKATAHAFLKLQAGAAKAGVTLSINSGFRTMSEQQYLYNCYLTKKCNSGNLAAKPGYSNHQNGRALDIGASNYTWLRNNASKFGFKATVPSERWHYEYSSADPGGPCSASHGSAQPPAEPTSDTPDDDDQESEPTVDPGTKTTGTGSCFSATLQANRNEGACVQAESDSVVYQCHDGQWYRGVKSGKGPYGACTSTDML